MWPVPQGGGMTYGWWLTDVTARHAAEAARAEQMGVARMMVDSLPLAAAAMDLDGSVLAWNRAARELLGLSEEELAGRPNPAVVDEGLLDSARSAPEPVRGTALAELRDGGTLPVELTLAPLVDAGGKVRGTVSLIRPADAHAEGRGWTEAEMRRGCWPRPPPARWPTACARQAQPTCTPSIASANVVSADTSGGGAPRRGDRPQRPGWPRRVDDRAGRIEQQVVRAGPVGRTAVARAVLRGEVDEHAGAAAESIQSLTPGLAPE